MSIDTPALGPAGLARFQELRIDAINTVAERFYTNYGPVYARFGQKGREACRDDLSFHLEFLRPVLEFGLIQPMVDYLHWLAHVLSARGIPADHLPQSLDWLSEFFDTRMERPDADIVVMALQGTKTQFLDASPVHPVLPAMALENWPEWEAFESVLLAGDRRGAGGFLDRRLEQGCSLIDAEVRMIQPALYGIGQKWQSNQVSIAQEHLATAIAQSVMTQGLLKSEVPASNGRKVLLACVEGNIHSVGLQMVADAFQLAGWDVQYLGANVPTSALIQQVTQYKPDLLGLSVSFAQQLRVVREIMARLTQVQGTARPAVILGGLAINQFSRLAGELGADAWSPDAHSAVASAPNFSRQAGL